VSLGELSFCFVYKFHQRFGVVANAICQGLGMDTSEAVAECRRTNMYLDNFATCEDTCGDTC
jgi:putative flavoprotein involved in K+ transport